MVSQSFSIAGFDIIDPYQKKTYFLNPEDTDDDVDRIDLEHAEFTLPDTVSSYWLSWQFYKLH